MQIIDINNSQAERLDKLSMGIDAYGYQGKLHANSTVVRQDAVKFDKDNLGVIDMSNSTYNNPNKTIMDNLSEDIDKYGSGDNSSLLSRHNFDVMEELGFSPEDMDEKEFVDIADKIRIALAKGGADISMMGDVSDAAIASSGSYTQAVEHALREAQLPSDNEVIDDSILALREVDEIRTGMVSSEASMDMSGNNSSYQGSSSQLSDETIKYMLSNELEPTIDNIYKAVVSSNDMSAARELPLRGDMTSLESQFKDILAEAGLQANEDNIKDCFWMVENRISVNPDQLIRLGQLREFTLPGPDEIINSITDAILEGNRPEDAYLISGHSDYAKARAIEQGVLEARDDTIDDIISDGNPITIGNVAKYALADTNNDKSQSALKELEAAPAIPVAARDDIIGENVSSIDELDASTINDIKAKKELAQIQLMMTSQANYSLIKRGYDVDTMPLTQYIDTLTQLENQLMEAMLGDKSTLDAIETLSDSLDAVRSASFLPDYATPLNALNMSLRSLSNVSVSFSQAASYYEASATEVRLDLGDSINKAFDSVDNLLEDMGLELSDENRRAVRILGYNQMEINEESVREVKATDMTVTRTLDNLKPGVVAAMIKSGINPLDMTMEELYHESEDILSTTEISDEEERFSEFLWRLEQESGITEEERQGYIGVFRLIHQVNESDGAAIGMLLSQGAEVTMRSLLMATRTARHENRSYTVDDDFGGIERVDKDTLKIDEQIEFAIQSVSMRNVESEITPQRLMQFNSQSEYMSLTPEQLDNRLRDMGEDEEISNREKELDEAYNNMRRDEILSSYRGERQVIEYLESLDMPLTSNNINAITQLMTDRGSMMYSLLNREAHRRVGLDKRGSYAHEVGMEIEDDSESLEDEVADIIANLIHEYGEAVKTPEDMAEAEQRLEEMAENVMKNMIVEEDVDSIDVRGMHLIKTQIKTLGEVSKRVENYTVPIMVADEVGNLSLKIVRGKEEKGIVDIAFDMDRTGRVTASFRYEAGAFTGSINCEREATRDSLSRNREILQLAVSEEAGAEIDITYEWDKTVDATGFIMSRPNVDYETVTRDEAIESGDETQRVLTSTLYGMARAFIQSLSQLA